jgi:hypothetical protein
VSPAEPAVVDGGAGVVPPGLVALAPLPVALPLIVLSPPALNLPARPVAPPPPATPQSAPRAPAQEPSAGRETLPAAPPGRADMPETFRVGYPEYLRSARMVEVAGLAVPGVAGILVLTAVGGLVGYRQAKAGFAVRAGGTSRFLH